MYCTLSTEHYLRIDLYICFYISFNVAAVPSRDHVFHIRFPSEWKTLDIIRLFSPFGWENNNNKNKTSVAPISLKIQVQRRNK